MAPRIVTDAELPVAVAVDAEHVYWAELQNGIMRVPKTGGEPERVAEGRTSWPIVVDAQTVFWTTFWEQPAEVRSAPTDGGPVTILAQSEDSLTDLAQDGDFLYWLAHARDGTQAEVTRVAKLRGHRSEVVVVRPRGVHDLTAAYGQVAWAGVTGVERLGADDVVETIFAGWALAVGLDDHGGIHFSATGDWDAPGTTIFTATAAGLGPIYEASLPVTALLADDEFIYFVTFDEAENYGGDDALWRVPRLGGDAECLVQLRGVGNFRLDGETIYWSAFSEGRIMALDL